ncbi:hypothetical protein [Neisseria meningitidis]|jgi:epsilon_1 antitoxin|uniref:hypothetical protein n=1 Tax=Neisseria meningitidis TaxID=487 RepID=UPI001C5A8B3E|nr:hypothetical protein [Neisseria meningitidis]MBW3882491.1 hypothetical protein [Neisseria meningitidis]
MNKVEHQESNAIKMIKEACEKNRRMMTDEAFRKEVEKRLYAGPSPELLAKLRVLWAANKEQ